MKKPAASHSSSNSINAVICLNSSSSQAPHQNLQVASRRAHISGNESDDSYKSASFAQTMTLSASTVPSLEKDSSSPRLPSLQAEGANNSNEHLFRREYIQRLSNMKIIRQPRQSKPHQTLVIFDWDDTLFPTTFLKHVGFSRAQSEAKILQTFQKVDKLVSRILLKATRAGVTYIITNAMKNWVESSCETFFPTTFELMKSNQVTVVSARAEYEKLYPDEPKRWKQEAFLVLKEKLEDSTLTNIICLGDSSAELEAAQHVCSVLNQTLLKTIKFKKGPRIEELAKQLEAVIDKFDQIYMTLKSLNIKIAKKNN